MGNPKQKWTSEEEEALRQGVAKHGTGKWKNIQRDPEFNPFLFSRSNIDLKDKWRNMSVSAGGQGPREKSRTPKPKASSDVPAVSASTPQISGPTTPAAAAAAAPAPVAHDTSTDVVMDDSSKNCGPKYTAMIFEALAALKEPTGSDTSAIFSYIEQRHEVPQNFRRLLSSRLRRLVAQEKLEKMQNCYKLKTDALFGTKTPTPKQKDIRPKQLQSTASGDTVDDAAVAAAYKVAEAENKSFVAAEAVKEAERVSMMAEETDSLLQIAKEVFEKCSQGEIVLMA